MIDHDTCFATLFIQFDILNLSLGIIVSTVRNFLRAGREPIEEIKPLIVTIKNDKLRLIGK
ncbi:hypothetical protein D3C85_1534640 [compost metagenome]